MKLEKMTYAQLANDFIRTRSEKSYDLLYKKLYPPIRNYVYGIVKDIDAVDDIVSNTMIKLYTRIDEYNPVYQITTWVYRIAYVESIQFIRERNSKIFISNEYEVANGIDNSQFGKRERNMTQFFEYDEVDKVKDEDDLMRRDKKELELYNRVIDEIYQLKEIYRIMIVDRFLNRLSYREIEEKYNEPFISEYLMLQRDVDDAKNSGNMDLFWKLKHEKDAYEKKNMISCQTVKNRIARGRKILLEKLKVSTCKMLDDSNLD